jgi:hypothetical protein
MKQGDEETRTEILFSFPHLIAGMQAERYSNLVSTLDLKKQDLVDPRALGYGPYR